jgi:hydroxyacyl-ACP dehydratase HTD2-like protein with hotdog domain
LSRFNSSSAGAPKPKTLDEWIANPPTLEGLDCLHHEHLGDVFVTLPTRDGSRQAFQEAKPGVPLGYGHHLAFFHHRKPEWLLREDGTEDDISPPDPFITRMWAGGKIKFDVDNPLIVGTKTRSKHHVKEALKKGFEKGKPMVFVTQEIAYTMEGKTSPSVVEERQHVFLPEGRVVRKEPRVGRCYV